MSKVIDEIQEEYERARSKWSVDFDDRHTANDWASYITMYLGKAIWHDSPENFSTNMKKVAAIIIGALEAVERNGSLPARDYDKDE